MNTENQLAAYINPDQEWFSKDNKNFEKTLIPYRGEYNKWGFCTPDKKVLLNCVYEDAKQFNEGVAMVKVNSRWGAIDNRGKQIIPCIYEDVSRYFQDGLATVKLNGRWGLINKSGKLLSRCFFDSIDSFSEGFARIKLQKSLYAYDDVINGISKFQHSFSLRFDGNGEYGYIDKTGKVVTPCIFEEAEPFSNGFARVSVYDKWYLIDGSHTLETSEIEKQNKFVEGLAEMRGDNYKYGFMDKSGNNVIPCIYDKVYDFEDGLALVKLKDKYGYIDKLGKEIIPCIYEDYSLGSWRFSESLVGLKLKGKYGFLDKTGNVAIPFIYDYASNFKNGMATVQLKSKWERFFGTNSKEYLGYIDKTGKLVTPCIYNGWDFFNDIARVIFKGKQGYINKEGLQYWDE